MISIQDETDLLPAVYDGPFEQPMWSTFLERLRQRTRADFAQLLLQPPDGPGGGITRLAAGPPGTSAPVQWDTMPPLVAALREERVYALADLVQPGNTQQEAFRAQLTWAERIDALRIMRVTEPGGLGAWLVLTRAGPDFAPADGAVLSRIAPHLRRSLRSYAAIERERSRARMAAQVMERLNFGWVRLDATGVVIEESPEAARLLQHGAGLRRTPTGHLIAADPLIDRKLSAALRSVILGDSAQPRALNVAQEPWVDLLLVRAAPDPGGSNGAAAVVAYIQGDSRPLANRHEQLAELFGLLPSEARFALALSRGLSISEAAASLGITVETARNYSKKVYAKMGARGQADLIRFILTSVLALA